MMIVFAWYYASAQGTRIEPGTGIRVETGSFLDIGSGNLILESDATGDASLLDYGSVTYSGAGEAGIQRYLTQGRWHMISSPVNGAVSEMFLSDYLQNHTEPTNGWSDIAPVDVPLNIMQGYALWSIEAAPSTEVFSGNTNSGSLSKNFTRNGAGWNLVGNPYPSTLDWDAVTIPAELNGAIWLFDPTIGSLGDYRYYINGGGGGNTTSQFIPSCQGFFVKAVSGSGTLTLDNSDRTHGGQAFYKNNEEESILVLETSGNGVDSRTAIRFNQNATQDVDRLYDVYKIFSDSPDVPILYTKAAGANLAINTFSSTEGNEVVPVWFRAGLDGEYMIKASELETFEASVPVYIQDIETGILQDLRQNPQYGFTYKSGTDKAFLVYFTDLPAFHASADNIHIYAESKNLHVDLPVSYLSKPGFTVHIMVFDLNGQCIMKTIGDKLYNTITLTANRNIYLVKVITDIETANAKVFLN